MSGGHIEHVEHHLPKSMYFVIFGALMVLTALTVGLAFVNLGQMNIVVALAVAIVKASLVVMFFMHLKYESPADESGARRRHLLADPAARHHHGLLDAQLDVRAPPPQVTRWALAAVSVLALAGQRPIDRAGPCACGRRAQGMDRPQQRTRQDPDRRHRPPLAGRCGTDGR